MLLLNLRTHVDKLDVHMSDMKIQCQNHQLEIAGYKSRVAELEEAERERMKLAMCHICYEIPNSHFLSCGHAFCQECILQWVLVNGTCPTCRMSGVLLPKAYNSVIVLGS